MKKSFYSSCVGWPSEFIDVLRLLIDDCEDIEREEFLQNIIWSFEQEAHQVIPASDWAISYHKYKDVYFYRHSKIEYVFAVANEIESIQLTLEADAEEIDEVDVYHNLIKNFSNHPSGLLNRKQLIMNTKNQTLLVLACEDTDETIKELAIARIKK